MIAFSAMGHIFFAGAVLYPFIGASDVLFAALFGSLLPDIDHPQAMLGRFNPLVGFMTHRGHTHSIIGCALLSLPFIAINPLAAKWVFYGSILHLFGDKVYSWLPGRCPFTIKVW